MKTKSWLVSFAGSFFVLFFGLSCLNYTKYDAFEHHQESARERGFPEPSKNIFRAGTACVAIGGGLCGFLVGRGRGRR